MNEKLNVLGNIIDSSKALSDDDDDTFFVSNEIKDRVVTDIKNHRLNKLASEMYLVFLFLNIESEDDGIANGKLVSAKKENTNISFEISMMIDDAMFFIINDDALNSITKLSIVKSSNEIKSIKFGTDGFTVTGVSVESIDYETEMCTLVIDLCHAVSRA